MTNVKIYGARGGRFGTDQDGMERFWRNIFAGCASSRFHEKHLGGGELAARMMHGARTVTDTFDLFHTAPHNDLLLDREPNRAYCLAAPGKEYAVYFPAGGNVSHAIPAASNGNARCAGTTSTAGVGQVRTASHPEIPSSWRHQAPVNGLCSFDRIGRRTPNPWTDLPRRHLQQRPALRSGSGPLRPASVLKITSPPATRSSICPGRNRQPPISSGSSSAR